MVWGYFIIGICIGALIGATAAIYVAHKDATFRGMAMQIQGYCTELDCFECEFMSKDGRCRIETPVRWELDKEE